MYVTLSSKLKYATSVSCTGIYLFPCLMRKVARTNDVKCRVFCTGENDPHFFTSQLYHLFIFQTILKYFSGFFRFVVHLDRLFIFPDFLFQFSESPEQRKISCSESYPFISYLFDFCVRNEALLLPVFFKRVENSEGSVSFSSEQLL